MTAASWMALPRVTIVFDDKIVFVISLISWLARMKMRVVRTKLTNGKSRIKTKWPENMDFRSQYDELQLLDSKSTLLRSNYPDMKLSQVELQAEKCLCWNDIFSIWSIYLIWFLTWIFRTKQKTLSKSALVLALDSVGRDRLKSKNIENLF